MTRAQALRRVSGLLFKVQFGAATAAESTEMVALKAQFDITDEEAANVPQTQTEEASAKRAEELEYSGTVIPTLTENVAKRGLELKFSLRPAKGATESLRKAGWRWHNEKGLWYIRKTDEAFAFARSLIDAMTHEEV